MVATAVGRHSGLRELLCGNKVEIALLDASQTTYNPSNVRSVGHSRGAYTFWQPAVGEVRWSRHRGGAAKTESIPMGERHGGRSGMLTSPERITKAS